MMKKRSVFTIGMLCMLTAGVAVAAPFGEKDDVTYAGQLWKMLEMKGMVGMNAIMSTPYIGVHPHGAILDTMEAKVTVDGTAGTVIVKRNYGGEGVNKKAVADDPDKWLKAVTVMFKRAGYDADNRDWFWVKYSAKGDVLKNPKGMPLAGRVAKGAPQGCISCHTAAPGGDMVFNHNRYVQ